MTDFWNAQFITRQMARGARYKVQGLTTMLSLSTLNPELAGGEQALDFEP